MAAEKPLTPHPMTHRSYMGESLPAIDPLFFEDNGNSLFFYKRKKPARQILLDSVSALMILEK